MGSNLNRFTRLEVVPHRTAVEQEQEQEQEREEREQMNRYHAK